MRRRNISQIHGEDRVCTARDHVHALGKEARSVNLDKVPSDRSGQRFSERCLARSRWTEENRRSRLVVENQWSIGTVAGALQPVVAKSGLINIPERALYSWQPTSMLGVYRVDEFFWDKTAGREALTR